MGTLSLTLPTVGQPNSTEDPKVLNGLTAIQTLVNGNLDGANVSTAILPYKPVWTYAFSLSPVSGTSYYAMSSGAFPSGTISGAGTGPNIIPITAADLAISGKTTQLRMTAAYTVPVGFSGTITLGLYAFTTAGNSTNIGATLGSVVSGSTVALTNPASLAQGVITGSDFAVPANGAYILGLAASGTMAIAGFGVELQAHYT